MNARAKKELPELFSVSSPLSGLTEGGNVDFAPGKFRSDKSGTSMRSVCVIPVNNRADVPSRDVHRYFLCFERSPNSGKPA